jgi:hypothetical protein
MTETKAIRVYASSKTEELFRDITFTRGQLPQLLKETRKVHRKLVQFHNASVNAPKPDVPPELYDKLHPGPPNKLYQAYEEYKQRYKDFYDIVYSNDYIVYGIFIGCKNSNEITEYYKILEINRDMKILAGEAMSDFLSEIPFKNRGREKVTETTIREAKERRDSKLEKYEAICMLITAKLKEMRARHKEKTGENKGYKYFNLNNEDRRKIAKMKHVDPLIVEGIEKNGVVRYAEQKTAKEMGLSESVVRSYLHNKTRHGWHLH